MRLRPAVWTAAVVIALSLAACGWRIRGSGSEALAGSRVFVASDVGTGAIYRQTLASLRDLEVNLADSRAAAGRVLVLVDERTGQVTVGLDRRGRANEKELRYHLAYRVEGPEGKVWLSRQTLSLSRTYAVNATDALAQQGQRALIVRELREEAVGLMIARAARVSAPGGE